MLPSVRPTAAVAPRLLVAEAEYVFEQAEEEAGSRLGSDDKRAIGGGGGGGRVAVLEG